MAGLAGGAFRTARAPCAGEYPETEGNPFPGFGFLERTDEVVQDFERRLNNLRDTNTKVMFVERAKEIATNPVIGTRVIF
jgi:hypothetical protein